MKQTFQNAARATLRVVMSKTAATNETKVQAVFQLARAPARGDARMAERATKTFPPLAACVKIQHTCVTLTQPAALERVVASIIHADLATRSRDEADTRGPGKQPPRTFPVYLRRWQALWATSGWRVLLGEVTAEPGADDDPARPDHQDPDLAPASHERLRAHWAGHFAAQRNDKRLAADLDRSRRRPDREVHPGLPHPLPTLSTRTGWGSAHSMEGRRALRSARLGSTDAHAPDRWSPGTDFQ